MVQSRSAPGVIYVGCRRVSQRRRGENASSSLSFVRSCGCSVVWSFGRSFVANEWKRRCDYRAPSCASLNACVSHAPPTRKVRHLRRLRDRLRTRFVDRDDVLRVPRALEGLEPRQGFEPRCRSPPSRQAPPPTHNEVALMKRRCDDDRASWSSEWGFIFFPWSSEWGFFFFLFQDMFFFQIALACALSDFFALVLLARARSATTAVGKAVARRERIASSRDHSEAPPPASVIPARTRRARSSARSRRRSVRSRTRGPRT